MPPVNAFVTALDETATFYDSAGGRISSIVSCPAGSSSCTTTANADRHTDMTYDTLGRATAKTVYAGTGTSSPALAAATRYDGLGETLSVRTTPTGATADTIESTYDTVGRVTAMYEGSLAPGGGNPQTTGATYNPDGTLATRTDYAVSTTASVYGYDILGHLTSATSPVFGTGVSAGFTWRLDGLMASRTWSTGPASLVFGYDGAKRAIRECNGSGGSCSGASIDIERAYDEDGDVLSETQTISGADPSTNGTQSFTYDALRRVVASSLNDGQGYAVDKAYTYDADSNRTSVTVGGVLTDSFSFDAADQTRADNGTAFGYDRYGNLTSSSTSAAASTAYGYDLADRLKSITQAGGSIVGFAFDAAGRHATRTGTGGATIDTYAYLGTSDSVIKDVSTSGAGYTLKAAVDSAGDRLASSSGGGFAWVLPDLHGNVAAQCSATGSITDVFRYDAYGKAVGTSITGSVQSPWRYQGRILESTAGADVYDAGARAYVPDLGTFTSLDSVTGSAQNPLSLNRYLYANANPATLIDPSGHRTVRDDEWYRGAVAGGSSRSGTSSGGGTVFDGGCVYHQCPTNSTPVAPAAGPCADPSRWCGNTPPAVTSCFQVRTCDKMPETPADSGGGSANRPTYSYVIPVTLIVAARQALSAQMGSYTDRDLVDEIARIESETQGKQVSVTELIRDGHTYFGGSGEVDPAHLQPGNAISPTHSEGDVLGQSSAAGDTGRSARMVNSMDLCDPCGVKSPNLVQPNQNGSGILTGMRESGVDVLDLVTPSGEAQISFVSGEVTVISGQPWTGARSGPLPSRWLQGAGMKFDSPLGGVGEDPNVNEPIP